MTSIVYSDYAEAVLRAQAAREKLELFTRPVEVVSQTESACVYLGWTLVFDPVAALAHAMNEGTILSVCCVCGATIGEKDPRGAQPGLSHGYCTRCAEAARNEMMSL